MLAPYIKVWDEALLSAALFFLREELGFRNIWYHTWESGNALKGIEPEYAPPRSLYQWLPRQFCFLERDEVPRMVQNRATEKRLCKAKRSARFYWLGW